MSSVFYPYLPEEGRIDYVGETDRFMSAAKQICQESSSDYFHPTGAVVVAAGEIIGRGANQARLHNPRLARWHQNGFCLRRFLKIPSGKHYWICPACSPVYSHAEQRAVRSALRGRQTLTEATLYLWGHWWCCKPCWDAMLAAGITQVYLLEESEALWK